MRKTCIVSTSKYLPDRVVSNDELEKYMDTSDEWIYKRTGIKNRRWIDEGSNLKTSDLAFEAAVIALERAGWNYDDIDYIIMATQTPDLYIPGAAPIFQMNIGLETTPCLDIRQHCLGFLYGLQIADSLILSKMYKRVLLICSEVQSTGIDISSKGRDMSVIFADGAGCVCLEGMKTNDGILATVLHTQGEYHQNITLDLSVGYKEEWIKEGRHWPRMNGKAVFVHAVKRLPEVVHEVLDKANMKLEDIDMFIPHQANQRINDAVADRLNIPRELFYSNIENYGNTTAATIPIALDEVFEYYSEAKTLMFLGYGAGEHWGATIYRRNI